MSNPNSDDSLPDTQKEPMSRENVPWMREVNPHVIEITRHDTNDVIVGKQYLVLFVEDADEGRFVASNVLL